MLKIFLPSSALLLGVMYVNVYAMMCSFSKKNLLKIKKWRSAFGAPVPNTKNIMLVCDYYLSGKANTKRKSNTKDIRARKEKENRDRKYGTRKN